MLTCMEGIDGMLCDAKSVLVDIESAATFLIYCSLRQQTEFTDGTSTAARLEIIYIGCLRIEKKRGCWVNAEASHEETNESHHHRLIFCWFGVLLSTKVCRKLWNLLT